MEYSRNILGEFKDKKIENIFLESEVRKSLKLARLMILLAGIVNLLLGFPDYIFRQDVNIEILNLSFATRIIISVFGIFLFIMLKRIKKIKVINGLIFAFAVVIYVVHLYVATKFAPVQIMFETFNLVILTTCLFLTPNRWIINLCVSLAFFVLYIIMTPQICTTTHFAERLIAMSYVCWNTIVISILFYSIYVYKRNQFAKASQLEELVHTDQLTKIQNRKACDDILESTCQDNADFSIIMFDIDNFKLINDTYGHVTGDEVLVSITEFARKTIRKDDLLTRWGGEEFVIILPDTKLSEALELAKRVKEQVSQITHDHISQKITCSFGVTAFVEGDNAKSIIRRVDQLLYLAKEYGKNRVVAG